MPNALVATITPLGVSWNVLNILAWSIMWEWYALHPNASAICSVWCQLLAYTTILPGEYYRISCSIHAMMAAPISSRRPCVCSRTMRTTRYAILWRLIHTQIQCTMLGGKYICWHNRSSSSQGIIAVNNNMGAQYRTNCPNCVIDLWKSYWWCNTMWHSLIIIRSNWPVNCLQFKNVLNVSSRTADSGVINTIDAPSAGCQWFHATHRISNSAHQRCKSSRNDTNGMTTTVVPPRAIHASNMNNKLLPPPVGIMPMTGLCLWITACTICFCSPQNAAFGPIILRNAWSTSMCCVRCHCSSRLCCASSVNHDVLDAGGARNGSASGLDGGWHDTNPNHVC